MTDRKREIIKAKYELDPESAMIKWNLDGTLCRYMKLVDSFNTYYPKKFMFNTEYITTRWKSNMSDKINLFILHLLGTENEEGIIIKENLKHLAKIKTDITFNKYVMALLDNGFSLVKESPNYLVFDYKEFWKKNS